MPKNNTGRVRELHPEFFTDEKLLQVSLDANRLYTALWGLTDREGCLEELHPITLKARFFAAWNVDCRPMMDELTTVGLVVRYQGTELGDPDARGLLNLLWLPGFRKRNTRLHPKEMNTRLEPCPKDATPFANWRTDKENREPKPQVEPRSNPGTPWVVPGYGVSARDLAGPAGPSGPAGSPPYPPRSEGGSKSKPPRRTRRTGHDPNDGIVPSTPAPPRWSPATPAGAMYAARLGLIADSIAVTQLEQLVPSLEGEQLVVETHDAFFADYVAVNYLALLNGTGPPVELRCPTK